MSEKMDFVAAERLLNLPDTYTAEDVNRAWRDSIVKMHPDVRSGVDRETANADAVRINSARSVLLSRFAQSGKTSFRRSTDDDPDRKQPKVEVQTDRPKPKTPPRSNENRKPEQPTRSPADQRPQTSRPSGSPTVKTPPRENRQRPRSVENPSNRPKKAAPKKPAVVHYGWSSFKEEAGSIIHETGLLDFNTYKRLVVAFVKLLLADDAYPAPYDEKARLIKRLTGRIAVLFYLAPFFICMRVCASSPDPSLSSYGMMMGARILFAGIFNVFIPVITGLIRHFPLKKLRKQIQDDNT